MRPATAPYTLIRRFPGLIVRVEGPSEVLDELSTLLPEAPGWIGAIGAVATSTIRLVVGETRQRVLADGVSLWSAALEDAPAPVLEWAVVRTVAERAASRYLVFHAGAVSRGSIGFLMPGASGSGKSTLVGGLLAAGWTYFSDDIAAVDLATLELLPILKALCIKGDALPLLADRLTDLRGARPYRRFAAPEVRYALPPADRLPESPVPVHFVIFPRYTAGAETELAPLARSAALALLLETCSNSRDALATTLGPLLEMLRRAEPYTLVQGNLDSAVGLMERLLDCR